MKEWLLIFRNCIIALIVIAIGQMIQPLQALEDWISPRRLELTWLAAGITFLGWALLIGGVIYRIKTGGEPLNQKKIEATVKSVKDSQSIPYTFRVSKYIIPLKARGSGFSDEVSFSQLKAAWRQRLFFHDPRWRGLLIIGFGAMFMAIGGFGLIIILGAPGLKLLAGGALLYAIVRTLWAFSRA